MQHPMVTCTSCGKRISSNQILYRRLKNEGELHSEDIFTKLNIKRYCCMINVANPPIQPIQPTKIPEDSKIKRRPANHDIVHVVKLGSIEFIKYQDEFTDKDKILLERSENITSATTSYVVGDRPILED